MQVVFQPIESPCVVEVEGRPREIWPVVVDVAIEGRRVPLRFAWDRYHRVLRVDERWEGRALLGDREAKRRAARLAREVIRRAAEAASGDES